MRSVVVILILVAGFYLMSQFSFLATHADGRVRSAEYAGVLLPLPIAALIAWGVWRLWPRRPIEVHAIDTNTMFERWSLVIYLLGASGAALTIAWLMMVLTSAF